MAVEWRGVRWVSVAVLFFSNEHERGRWGSTTRWMLVSNHVSPGAHANPKKQNVVPNSNVQVLYSVVS